MSEERAAKPERKPIRVLLLDDREENLILRSAILRQNGYDVLTSMSIEEAQKQLPQIDIAVLDYHLGAGKFGTDVAEELRRSRPQVPIIILSATLERKFGGIADMHLLKGYSSVDDLLVALRHFEAKRRGKPVVVDARDFYYSRISMAMGDDVVLEVLDADGVWQYVNDYFAALFEKKREWFVGRNMFEIMHRPDVRFYAAPQKQFWFDLHQMLIVSRKRLADQTREPNDSNGLDDRRHFWR